MVANHSQVRGGVNGEAWMECVVFGMLVVWLCSVNVVWLEGWGLWDEWVGYEWSMKVKECILGRKLYTRDMPGTMAYLFSHSRAAGGGVDIGWGKYCWGWLVMVIGKWNSGQVENRRGRERKLVSSKITKYVNIVCTTLNVRGMGNPVKHARIGRYVQELKADVMFLQELYNGGRGKGGELSWVW